MRQRAYVEILSTWEVWRALKRLELHSAAPRATLTPLSCSPNFPRAQYLDIRTLTHELIVNDNMLSSHVKISPLLWLINLNERDKLGLNRHDFLVLYFCVANLS